MNSLHRVLIIGYGNPLRGDDAFGWRAAERLRELVHDPAVEILTVHQLTPDLMEPISRADRVVFIDAREGLRPGEVMESEVAPQTLPPAAFTHSATPQALLAGAQALYGHAPTATVISVTGADFSLSEELSMPVATGLERAVAAAMRIVLANQTKTSDHSN